MRLVPVATYVVGPRHVLKRLVIRRQAYDPCQDPAKQFSQVVEPATCSPASEEVRTGSPSPPTPRTYCVSEYSHSEPYESGCAVTSLMTSEVQKLLFLPWPFGFLL